MIPITSEKVHGVLDDAIYTATLCMARDGKHFFFTSIAVDGNVVEAPSKRWSSRRAAMHALADIAMANRRPDGAAPASPFLGLTDDLFLPSDNVLIEDAEPVEAEEALPIEMPVEMPSADVDLEGEQARAK